MILFVTLHSQWYWPLVNDIIHCIHNDIKLNLYFCVSKNIIAKQYLYVVISLNCKVQFHCKQKEKSDWLFFLFTWYHYGESNSYFSASLPNRPQKTHRTLTFFTRLLLIHERWQATLASNQDWPKYFANLSQSATSHSPHLYISYIPHANWDRRRFLHDFFR